MSCCEGIFLLALLGALPVCCFRAAYVLVAPRPPVQQLLVRIRIQVNCAPVRRTYAVPVPGE